MTESNNAHYNTFVGLTHINLKIESPIDNNKTTHLQFLIDSGALYTVVPEKSLENLGVKKDSKREFIMADGRSITRYMGGAVFEYSGRRSFAPVMFGEGNDMAVLGATTLEALGFGLDPLKRKLFELPMRF